MSTSTTDIIYLSDIMGKCCPEQLEPDSLDTEITQRIKQRVLDRIEPAQPKRRRRIVRTALLVAAAAALFTTAAYALSEYFMSRENPEGPVSGYWQQLDESGQLEFYQEMNYPDAGMVLSFTGPEGKINRPEFRAFWLPSESTYGHTDPEGWTSYLTDSGEGERLPYVISTPIVHTGECKYIISGDPSVIKEEYWGDWYVLEISSDYSACSQPRFYENNIANYIFLFDQSRGHLVTVSGTSDMETLEHIARELEIREGKEASPEQNEGFTSTVSLMDLGRG